MTTALAINEMTATRTCRISYSRKTNTVRATEMEMPASWLVDARPALIPAAYPGMTEAPLPMMMLRGPVRASFAGLI